jgi:periplasmic divalent cation tolerance protein
MGDNQKIVVISSVTSEDIAIHIAEELLEQYAAACINILPKVHSIYRWQGQVCDDFESVLVIKTRKDKFSQVKAIISELSGYECPEILAFKVDDGAKQFLQWVDHNVELPSSKEDPE